MFTAKFLFMGLSLEDPHAHIAKLRSLCKSCICRLDLDMNVIGLRVFPLSLIEDFAIWFTEIPYNSIFTWDKLRDVFSARYYQVSKKLNHKEKVDNFVVLPGESVSSFWDRFTTLMKGVPNLHINNEFLKECFYRVQDDDNKVVLNNIVGGSYGECTYVEIAEKLEIVYHINKAWRSRKLNTGRNIFAVQVTNNSTTYDIHEELAHIRTELGLGFETTERRCKEGICSYLFD